jgi:hypothetical protein
VPTPTQCVRLRVSDIAVGKKKEHIGKTKIILTRYKISCLKSRTELSRGGGIWVDFDFVSVVEIDDQ